MATYINYATKPVHQNQKYAYNYQVNNNPRIKINNIVYNNTNQIAYQQAHNPALIGRNNYHQQPKINQIIKRNITPEKLTNKKKIISVRNPNNIPYILDNNININNNYRIQTPLTTINKNKVNLINTLKVSRNKSPPKIYPTNNGGQIVDCNNNAFLFDATKLNKKISPTNGNLLRRSFTIEKANNINNFFKLHCEGSQAGRNQNGELKTNQDNYLVKINVNNLNGFNIFGVLDGHGKDGHMASSFAKEYIKSEITKLAEKLCANRIDTPEKIYQFLKKNNFAIIKKLFKNIDIEMENQKQFESIFSGTTCNLIFQFNRHLLCVNVGDSRSILVYDNNKNMQTTNIFNLSYDHHPDINEECERVIKNGGEIHKLLDSNGKILGGPLRVWKKDKKYPGLAVTRSLGDLNAKTCGVIPIPQFIEYELNDSAKYMVICSDGVWEFLSSEQVKNIGNNFYANGDIRGHCLSLITSAMKMWENQDIIRDDITVVVVYF